MKTIRMPIHSFVDVITNSSTVIYVQCYGKTVELAKELINNILTVAGSDKTADDLFLFRVSPTENFKERFLEYTAENLQSEEDMDSDEAYDEAEKKYEYYLMNPDKRPDDWGKDCEYGWNMEQLELIPIKEDQETINLTKAMETIFSIDGERNG